MPTIGGYDCPVSGPNLASGAMPGNSVFFLTSFGGGSDTQGMSCGGTADGQWWYAAGARWRWPCGTKLIVTNPTNNRSTIVQVADVGPNSCVEEAAGGPVLDASPLVAQYLFGASGAGYSDHMRVVVNVADQSANLGPTNLIARITYDWRRYAIWGALALAGYAGFKTWQEGNLKIPGLPQPKTKRKRSRS